MQLRRFILVLLGLVLPFTVAAATTFPDVQKDYPHYAAVQKLVDMGVISGNPDGTFKPHNPVNRAAFLKMLYKASGRTPDSHQAGCFPKEIPADAWFAPFVCDALSHKFVQGYTDGTFRAGNPVTRAEAIKMILTVMEFPVTEPSGVERGVPYDVGGISTWYAKYVVTGFGYSILPIPGSSEAIFGPDVLLERGEAAAYIVNALSAKARQVAEQMQQEQHQQASSSSKSSASSGSSKSAVAQGHVFDVQFPILDIRMFDQKASNAYRFKLSESTYVDVMVLLAQKVSGTVSCRLYHLEEDGFATEYYLGIQDGQRCYIHAALTAGNYEIEIQATEKNASYEISVKEGQGDDSDGFSQAKSLDAVPVKTDYLDENDLEDWFKFTVEGIQGEEKQRTVSIVSASVKIGCLIYPAKGVDVLGFKQPDCGEEASFSPGVYYVSVRHPLPLATKITYTIQVK